MAEKLPDPQCLIVADADVLIRNALAEYLRHCGYKVFEAATSDEVIIALEEGAVKIDALLADAQLTGRYNAFELRLWVKDHFPDVEIVLAGSIDSAAKAAGHLCDEGPHLQRPYDPESVAAHIKRLLAATRRQDR
ncbi:DNA-binding transcriptional response regulator [Sphingopyxis sp. MSC1_008]|jgi:DNA-binding response OmpR family regulator|uniref:response regulator n=1 Tax=Sphingopyxis sp. MSC1_008 TaxID=2909265 RepID=UPI0020BE7B50|nr:response regulator [Sphingopyxis sp. MSC1_008]